MMNRTNTQEDLAEIMGVNVELIKEGDEAFDALSETE